MNIYQAALELRTKFAHTGIELEASEDVETNLYLLFHDALHTFLGAKPQESDEPIVLATELILGGQDWTNIKLLSSVSPDEISKALSKIGEDNLNIFISFYTNHFS